MQKIIYLFIIITLAITTTITNAYSYSFFGSDEEESEVKREVPKNKSSLLLSYSAVVKSSAPAVVNIYTKRKVKVRSFSPFSDPIFKQFFGNFHNNMSKTRERVESSLGSGVLVSKDGYVVTSNHVIKGSDEIRVVLSDRREFDAKIVLTDDKTDLALLKIKGSKKNFSYLEFMDSDNLEVGDIVLAIGNPFGVGQTVTSGIVSAVARNAVGISDYQFFIQTDAAINPGNSGGALVNLNGKLVGINTAIYTKSGGSNGIGFAIPANMVTTLLRSNENGGKLIRPWLGVVTQNLNQEIADSLGIEIPQGALIKKIRKGGAAEKAGLKVGDVVLALNGKDIRDEHELNFRVATYDVGTKVDFTILRNGKNKVLTVKMSPPVENPKRDLRTIKGNNPFVGAVIANLSPALAIEIGVDTSQEGVVVIKAGERNRIGVKPGDIILKINEAEISSTEEAEEILNNEFPGWAVTIKRGNQVINANLRGF